MSPLISIKGNTHRLFNDIKGKLVFTGFLLFTLGVNAQQQITVEDAMRIALENNYSIQLAKNDAAIAKNNNYSGAAGMMPVVTGTMLQDNQNANTNQKYISGAENNKTNAKSNQLGANIELGWTIFDGFKMFATKNRLKELQDIGELRMRLQIENIFQRVIRAYYDVVQAKQILQVNKQSVKLSEERMDLAKLRYTSGKVSRTEMLQAQVDLNTDKSALMRQETQFKNTKAILNQLLARDGWIDFDVLDMITLNKELKLDDLINKAHEQNVNILIAKRNKQVAQFSVNEIRAERMPVIQLRSGYNYNKQESESGFAKYNQSSGYHYGAGLSMNLFNGFSVSKRLQTAVLTARSNDLLVKDSINRVDVSITQSYNNYVMALGLVDFEKENQGVAQSNFDLASEQYKIGVITAIELRQAQQNLLLSQSRLTSAQYEAKLAETDLKRYTGELFKIN